jgi:hypothetical protein
MRNFKSMNCSTLSGGDRSRMTFHGSGEAGAAEVTETDVGELVGTEMVGI